MSALSDCIGQARRTQERLLAHQPQRIRDYVAQLTMPGRAGLLIGPRGTGKTTWLLRQSERRTISAS